MRIVLDLRIFGPKYGGLGRYNQQLLLNLAKFDHENEYIILVKQLSTDLPNLPANFHWQICPYHWYSLKEQIFLPFILKKLKPDLVHFPHFNVPILYKGKFIVTIHDLIMTKFPSIKTSTLNRFVFVFKRLAYQITIRLAIKRANKIIAVSQFTAEDIKTYFHLDKRQSEKVKVIYEGLTPIKDTTEFNDDLPDKFFLYVGNAYPHKNLAFLIDVFQAFLKNHPDFYLVLVGTHNYFYQQLELLAHKNVIFAGFVPDKKLAAYYRQSKAYIFPSLYEGFGLPPLEALAHQTPVLSSSASCLPEILADTVIYFDPQNKKDLLAKMENIIIDEDLKQQLKIKAEKLIAKYSWEKMAQTIIKYYK